MGGAWDGDWEGRIYAFVRAHGHDRVWSYLRANPGVSFVALAERIGPACAVQIERLALAECLVNREVGELVRDAMARSVHAHLPRGWGSGNELTHVQALGVFLLPEPYRTLASAMRTHLLEEARPGEGWLPASGDDARLRDAYASALASLSADRRQMIERGEAEREPGDVFAAAVRPVLKALPPGDGEAFARHLATIRPELRHLFAVYWCDAEVCNGGFHQFYTNSTGALGPEAAEGFAAIGLETVAAVVRGTLAFFDAPFPRERAKRIAKLPRSKGKRAEWDPFVAADEAYYAAFRQRESLLMAADTYAARHVGS